MAKPKKHWRTIVRLIVCALLLLWVFHIIFVQEGRVSLKDGGISWDELSTAEQLKTAWTSGPKAIWTTIKAVNPWSYGLSLIFMGATLLIGAIRWRLALTVQGLDLPSRTAEISLVAHFFNSFLLGSTGGDLLKAYYAARETHHKKTEAVTTVFVDRLIGLFAMLSFSMAFATCNGNLILKHELIGLMTLTVGGMFGASAILVYIAFWGRNGGDESLLQKWLIRLPKGEYLQKSLAACRKYGRHRGFLAKSLALSSLLNLFCVLQFSALASGLGLNLSLPQLMFIVPAIICISALPITPNGLGLREHLFVGAMTVATINMDAKLALSLSLLAYSGSLVWSVIGGGVYVNLKESQHLDEVTQE